MNSLFVLSKVMGFWFTCSCFSYDDVPFELSQHAKSLLGLGTWIEKRHKTLDYIQKEITSIVT